MSVRTMFYMACTSCNNQFHDFHYGAYYGSEEEVKDQARKNGWRVDEPVANGSKWDFCPRCWAAHLSPNESGS
jgi:hypothetical protein